MVQSLYPVATPTSSPGFVFSLVPCVIHSLSVTDTSDATSYVMVFDASAVPANGTVEPLYCYELNEGSGAWSWDLHPARLKNGLAVVVSTTGPFTLTKSSGTVHMVAQFE